MNSHSDAKHPTNFANSYSILAKVVSLNFQIYNSTYSMRIDFSTIIIYMLFVHIQLEKAHF